MALFAYLIFCLTIFVVDLDASAAEDLREKIISEVKGYFDKELETLKRKHDTELATLDARLTKSQVEIGEAFKRKHDTELAALDARLKKSQAEIADLRSQNELLSNGLKKVLFTHDRGCKNVCQSYGGEEKHKTGGIRKMSEAKTPLQEHMKVSKGFQDRDHGGVESRKEYASIFSLNSAVTIGQALSTSGIKHQFRGTCMFQLFSSDNILMFNGNTPPFMYA